jgi:hypothetical protein
VTFTLKDAAFAGRIAVLKLRKAFTLYKPLTFNFVCFQEPFFNMHQYVELGGGQLSGDFA